MRSYASNVPIYKPKSCINSRTIAVIGSGNVNINLDFLV